MKKFLGLLLISAVLLSACSPTTSNKSEPSPTGEETMNDSMTHAAITSEKDFILNMIPHHQEAIDTSEIVAAQTSDPELKKFAQDVIQVQTSEVAQMEQWLKDWFQEEYTGNSNYQLMMGDLTQFQGKELERAYVEGMIAHHQGAIDMAKQVLTLNPRPEVQQMAEAIVTVQQTEVETLQGWLGTKYGDVQNAPSGHEGMAH